MSHEPASPPWYRSNVVLPHAHLTRDGLCFATGSAFDGADEGRGIYTLRSLIHKHILGWRWSGRYEIEIRFQQEAEEHRLDSEYLRALGSSLEATPELRAHYHRGVEHTPLDKSLGPPRNRPDYRDWAKETRGNIG